MKLISRIVLCAALCASSAYGVDNAIKPIFQTKIIPHIQSIFASQEVARPVVTPVKKQITFLVYIAGDNSLASFVQQDLNEMMRVGSNQNINVLAFVNTKRGKQKSTTAYLVMPGKLVQDGTLPAMDSGKSATALKAVEWAVKNYPSDMFVLVFWDHGSGAFNRKQGVRACCYDDTTGSYFKDSDLQQILSHIQKLRGGKKTDVVAFDACLMADAEVAYAIAPYARYLVASQETIPGEGYGYDEMLMRPAQGNITARQFSINAVGAFETVYAGIVNNYTLSSIDLSKMSAVTYNVKTLGQLLIQAMNSPQGPEVAQAIANSRNEKNCTHFEAAGHLDIIHFYSNLVQELNQIYSTNATLFKPILKVLNDGIRIINQAIVSRVHGDAYPLAHGLSIYFPGDVLDDSYPTTQWAQYTGWVSFIKRYLVEAVGV